MSVEKLTPPVWVAQPDELKRLVGVLARQPRVAVDTESNSLYAYREQVCLIQFSTPDTDYLVDPLVLPDLSPLGEIFANSQIEKIFHAVEYDLICLERDFGFSLTNLFDTMQAARILGRKAVGLESLLNNHFGVSMNKRLQRANWGRRPLTDEMKDYARFDTHFLIELRDILDAELKASGRWDLAQEDFRLSCEVHNNHNGKSELQAWERINGGRDLSQRDLTILNELCEVRERVAQRLDRPVFKVINDQMLAILAVSHPVRNADLEAAGLTEKQIRFLGAELLAAVRRGSDAPLVKRTPSKRPSDAFLLRLDALKNWRKTTARQMGVESDVILPKRFMHQLAGSVPQDRDGLAEIMGESPWRMEHYGQQILTVLDGGK